MTPETRAARDGRFERMQEIVGRAHYIARLAMSASRGEKDPDALAREEEEIRRQCQAITTQLRIFP